MAQASGKKEILTVVYTPVIRVSGTARYRLFRSSSQNGFNAAPDEPDGMRTVSASADSVFRKKISFHTKLINFNMM